MLNILIVEDEIPSRNSLIYDVSSIMGNKAEIHAAEDGVKALKLASEFRPDILITDIRMPHMLGTQLAEKILELFPSCKIIFLSGYSDKDFFKSAIKLGVIDYIEKPIDTDILEQALNKAVNAITEFNNQNSISDHEILSDLFKNKTVTTVSVPDNGVFAVIILSPCNEFITPSYNVIKDIAHKCELDILLHTKNTGIIELLLINHDNTMRSKIQSFFTRFFFYLNNNEKFKIAVGSVEYSSKEIYTSYQNAVHALDLAFFKPTNTVIYYDDVILINNLKETEKNFTTIANDIYSALISGDLHNALFNANELYKKLYKSNMLSSQAKKIYFRLSESIISYYNKFFPISDSENGMLYNTSSIFDTQTLLELHEYLVFLLNAMHSLTPTTTASLAELAIFYMEQHYTNPDLSISDIVHFCKINTTQLCSDFKKSTGHTINHYLTNIRIEAAKKLLADPSYKINDISDMCGFNYPKYFCRVFKKYTSLSPSDYRRNIKNKKN